MTTKEKKAHAIANNALYFQDNSDYYSALWQIVDIFDNESTSTSELDYIEEPELNETNR